MREMTMARHLLCLCFGMIFSNVFCQTGVDGSNKRLILSLYDSPPRRFLLPNARMPLHDDLLRDGYYTTRLWIGTPPQMFALIVDTGSTVTYVPCATCQTCGRHQDPKFRPDESSTYRPVKCNVDCTCDDKRENCVYERQYAEMSSSSGVLAEDIVSFGNLSELVPQRAVFGCENLETGDLYRQHADGIMGLGRGQLSIVDQLVQKKVINDSFSLCYGGMDVGGGAMILGRLSPPADMVFANSNPDRSPYYNIELKELHVAGKMLPLNQQVFDGGHGTVLDSGTTYAYLPEAAFLAFKDAIIQELQSLKQIPGPDPKYKDICFSGVGSDVSELSKTFPAVDMVFGNGQMLTLSPENYLVRHAKERGAYCLGVFQNGKNTTTLLGGILVRNTLVTYDREQHKIGFWKTKCSELWKRLQPSGALPPISARSENPISSTAGISPIVAPSGEPETNNSGALPPIFARSENPISSTPGISPTMAPSGEPETNNLGSENPNSSTIRISPTIPPSGEPETNDSGSKNPISSNPGISPTVALSGEPETNNSGSENPISSTPGFSPTMPPSGELETSNSAPISAGSENPISSTIGISPTVAPSGEPETNNSGSENPIFSTTGISSTVAPSVEPETNNSAEKNIEHITFSISLSINTTNLRPRIPELTQAISKELDQNASQVHLVKFISNGNGSLLNWSVSPPDSANNMSNATATHIISRLAEQKMHLPESFGSYKLVEWNVKVTPKRTWWQQHIAVVLASVFGLFACGGWYVWRQQKEQSPISYKPIDDTDAAVSEQELQPL